MLDWIVIGRLPKMFSRRLEYVKNVEELGRMKGGVPKVVMSMVPAEILSYGAGKEGKYKEKEREKEMGFMGVTKKKKSPFEFLQMNIEKY